MTQSTTTSSFRIDSISSARSAATASLTPFSSNSWNPKSNLKWIEDKVLQVAAYELINDGLYSIDAVGLVFFIQDGSVDEYFFDEAHILPYQEKWLNRLDEVRRIRRMNAAA